MLTLHDPTRTLLLGPPLAGARGALILLHGRGGSAHDLAGLASTLPADGVACLLPSATGNTWYPRRFLAPPAENEPWLGSALSVVEAAVQRARDAGIPPERIGLAGFSQGACLALEYAWRNPGAWSFVAGLSGALIGPLGTARTEAEFGGAPVLVACAEADDHIPLPHVEATVASFRAGGASVTRHVFPGRLHQIIPEEVSWMEEHLRRWR